MTVTNASSGLNKTDFLQLLVAQLQYQDPLSPMDQEQQVAQLAQFSTVEGIENLNASFGQLLELQMLGSGSQLLGANVEYQATADGPTATGVVDRLVKENNSLLAVINGNRIPLNRISAVIPQS